jgi:hypothetical protein
MKSKHVLFASIGLALAGSVDAAEWIVGGVRMDAVEWAKLCPSVEPVQVTRGGVTCAVVHPASGLTRRNTDYSGLYSVEKAPNCAVQVAHFERHTRAQAGADPWAHCKWYFADALELRSSSPMKYDDMPFEQWRAKYFAKYIVGGSSK